MRNFCRFLTSLVSHTLDACSKVHGLPHCQLGQVQVSLLNVGCSPLRDEALEGDAIVRDVS